MKKTTRIILCAAIAAILTASLGMTAFAAITSSSVASSAVASSDLVSSQPASSQVASSLAASDLLRDEAASIMPINENPTTAGGAIPNPHTGAENLAIPGTVALIAAAAAAITLAGKKK